MKCETCLPLVSEYFDGELEPRLATDVRAHIVDCGPCSGYYESLRRNQDIYDKFLDDVELSGTAWQGVQRRIRKEKSAGKRSFLSVFPVPRFQFVAATLVLVVIGLMLLQLARRPEQKQEVVTAEPARNELPHPENPVVVEHEFKKSRRSVTRRPVVTNQAQTVAMFERAMESARTELETNRPVTLKSDVARHFEKTRLLLLSLKNTPLSAVDTDVNVSYEKAVSRRLANSNLLLRRETTTAGNRSAADLLDRIEPLLIEIANLPDRASAREVELISQRIARKDVIGLLQSQTF